MTDLQDYFDDDKPINRPITTAPYLEQWPPSRIDDPSKRERILIECGRFIRPLIDAVENGATGAITFVERSGIATAALSGSDWDRIVWTADAALAVWNRIEDAIDGEYPDLEEFEAIIEEFEELFDSISELSEIDMPETDAAELGTLVLQYLIVEYLDTYHGDIYNGLSLTGVIRSGEKDPTEIDLESLLSLFTDPGTIPAKTFGWSVDDEEEFRAMEVLEILRRLCFQLGVSPTTASVPKSRIRSIAGLDPDGEDLPVFEDTAIDPLALRIPIISGEYGSVGVSILPASDGDVDGERLGIAALPFAAGELSESTTIELHDDWRFEFDASAAVDLTSVALRFLPSEDGLDVDIVGLGDTDVGIDVDGSFRLRAAIVGDFEDDEGEDADELVLLGDDDGTRLSLREASAAAAIEGDKDGPNVRLEAPTSGLVTVDPDVFDGFLSAVMPDDGLEYLFEVIVGWSSNEGLYLDKSGTLDASIPLNRSIGPVDLDEVYLSIGTWAGDEPAEDDDVTSITLVGALSGGIELGPVSGSVKRIGIEGEVGFPEDGDGEFGPVDLDVGFKPPEGIGLSVDAAAVDGGGYLEYDLDEERYAGVLQLSVGTLTINAVGLLTTQLPDGGDGFSLLVIISGEFEPVQLGFGFTLNGIGGLLGINRTMKTDPLREAVRDGRVDSVLFPDDPVADAQRIISDLRAFFPPKRGSHVFGPMAILGWGTPTIITADLGVILEIPSTKLAILGRISAALPDAEVDVQVVSIQMDVLGVINIPGKEISIDAALFDSKVLHYDLSGEMALRASWGRDSRFILSIGGFNPRYEPPSDLPSLDRLRMSMGDPDGIAYLEYRGYFALTSNTVQVGAGVTLDVEIGPGYIYGELDFDALLQFDPFEFVVDVSARLDAGLSKVGSVSITLEGSLAGPSPYHLQGEIDLPWPLGSASVCETFGDDGSIDSLPPADVFGKLLEELDEPGNWSAQRPAAGSTLVTVRETDDPERVKVHPLGTLSVRQTVVPLSTRIEKFGEARPDTYTRFDITGADLIAEADEGAVDEERTLGGLVPLTEQFAPADFEELSDDEKLESEAYVSMPAGTKVDSGAIVDGADDACQRKSIYKEVIEDEECNVRGVVVGEAVGRIDSVQSATRSPYDDVIEAEKYTSDAIKESILREKLDGFGDIDGGSSGPGGGVVGPDPAGTTQPPTGTTTPVAGGDPVDPVDPVSGGDSVDPVDPVSGGDPVDPVDPVSGGDPIDPVDSGTGSGGTDPVSGGDPIDPVTTPGTVGGHHGVQQGLQDEIIEQANDSLLSGTTEGAVMGQTGTTEDAVSGQTTEAHQIDHVEPDSASKGYSLLSTGAGETGHGGEKPTSERGRTATTSPMETSTRKPAGHEEPTGGGTEQLGRLHMREPAYVIVSTRDLTPASLSNGPVGPTTRSAARQALKRHLRENPEDEDRLRIVEQGRVNASNGVKS